MYIQCIDIYIMCMFVLYAYLSNLTHGTKRNPSQQLPLFTASFGRSQGLALSDRTQRLAIKFAIHLPCPHPHRPHPPALS